MAVSHARPVKHDHELDDARHPGCPMCDYIETLQPSVKRQKAADAMAKRYGDIANKSERRRAKHE